MNDLLHTAVSIACQAHAGQSDQQGEPYIFHVMRVALACEGEARIVALLHDVVEDSATVTTDSLFMEGFPSRIVDAVDALTRRKHEGETYAAYIDRVARNPLARHVKLADLADNLRPERIGSLPPEQAASLSKRYLAAYRTLTNGGA
jgi:guanosine-3',5'-bis(diphosphate) 3'-pyrophosphohydrolase